MTLKKYILPVLSVALVLGGVFYAGFFTGMNERPDKVFAEGVINKDEGTLTGDVDFSAFWRAWRVINEKHISGAEVSDQDKVYGAIMGLADSLDDPYTVFFPPAEAEIFESDITGSFSGVGMEIGIQNKILTVIAPLKGTPADRAGIRAGDQVIKIDDTDTFDLGVDKAVQLIRGENGSKVSLTVLRKDTAKPLTIDVVRDTITIPTLETKRRNDGVFVISLFNFSSNSPELFRDALEEFVNSGYDKLVLDLRGNPGGFLEAAVDMASWFLPVGKVVVKEDHGGKGDDRTYRSRGYDVFNDNLKFVILIDGGSASASEILAGALSEHGVAQLVGMDTFGKGSVQELVNITDTTALKVTIAKWLTPNGTSISEGGLKPDVKVEVTEADIEAGRDPQLLKAIEILKAR